MKLNLHLIFPSLLRVALVYRASTDKYATLKKVRPSKAELVKTI